MTAPPERLTPRLGEPWPDGRPLRLNLGSGPYQLSHDDGWVNVDGDLRCQPDVVSQVPPLHWPDASVAEVYLGHLLEHFEPFMADWLLRECYRVLVPGGRLGVVVPDTRVLMRRWLGQAGSSEVGPDGRVYQVADLDDVCSFWLFSTYQASPHKWAYDLDTLERALTRAGFAVTDPIDRQRDPRLSNGNWYQCGWDARKPDA